MGRDKTVRSDRYIEDIRRAQFDFSGKYALIALLTNPYFFVRKNLYENIRYFSNAMKGRVLDFGCGAKPYQSLFKKCTEYIGCDIEISGHDHKNESIDVYYDGKTLPFDDESFDSVFSSEVYEHVINLDEIIPELYRVLKPGGYMLVTVPFVWNEHEVPYDFRRYPSFGLKEELERYGFKVISQRKATKYIEILFQMFMEYLRMSFAEVTDSRKLKILFQRLVIFPTAVMGIIASLIMPKNWSLYGDNVVLCRKGI